MSNKRGRKSGTEAVGLMEERAGEKHQLNDLNDRLEYYVEYQREKRLDYNRMKEALEQAELDFDAKMKQKDREHARDRDGWNNERSALRMDLAQQRDDAKRYKSERDELDAKNFRLEKGNKELEGKCGSLEKELGLTNSVLQDTRNQLESKSRALDKSEKECSALEAQNRQLKGENQVLTSENAQLRDQWNNAREALDREKKDRAKEVATLRSELREREAAHKQLEKEMREEFERKLKKWIDERKRQYAAEKAEWMKIFKDEYNRKLKNLQEANAAKQQQIGQLIKEKNRLNDKILDLNTRVGGLERERAKLESEVSGLRRDLDNAHQRINDLRAELARKDQEYQELLAAHVPLQKEIMRYRQLMQEEETQTGFSSAKRQKLTGGQYVKDEK